MPESRATKCLFGVQGDRRKMWAENALPGRMDWSGLPESALFCVLMRLGDLADFCSFRRVCAQWRRVAKAEAAAFMASLPPLLFHPSENRLYSVTERCFYKREGVASAGGEEDYDEGDVCGFSHGYLIYRDRRLPAPRLAIVHPAVGRDFGAAFPAWPRGAARGALLTAPPTSSDCILLANDRRRLLYCRPGDREWAVHDWPSGWSLVSMVASNNGKVYGLTQSRKLVAVEFLPAGVRVTHHNVADFPFEGFVRLASYGDELLAFPHRSDIAAGRLTGFDLYRLDSARGRWVEVEDMGGRALYVSCGMWAVLEDPSKWGWDGDCVYQVCWNAVNARCLGHPVTTFYVCHLKDDLVERWFDDRLPHCPWTAAAWVLTNQCSF